MKKLKSCGEIPVIVKNESFKDFFKRGRAIAKLIDQKKSFSPIRTISFEDMHDLGRIDI